MVRITGEDGRGRVGASAATAQPAGPLTGGRALLSAEEFFALADEVLVQFERAPFAENGSQRAIIEVRPDDRVLQIVAGPGSGKTEVLVWRVLFELLVRGSEASSVLLTT